MSQYEIKIDGKTYNFDDGYGDGDYGALGTASWSISEIVYWGIMGLAGIIALLFAALQLGGVM